MGEQRLLGKWLGAVSRFHQMSMAKQLEPMGIGLGQYTFLLSVCSAPGIRQDHLAEELYLNKSSVARAITQLEENGFLAREVDPADRRAYRIYPTDKAWSVREEILRCGHRSMERLAQDMKAQEQDELCRLLEHMYRNCTKTRGGACRRPEQPQNYNVKDDGKHE